MVHESQLPSRPVMPERVVPTVGVKGAASEGSFEQVLERQRVEGQGVKFSAHASQRLEQRRIALSEGDLARIAGAADKAAARGSRESLFLLDDLGLIVNVRNRTVLTAITPERMREGIVTNIDSTVIIGKT